MGDRGDGNGARRRPAWMGTPTIAQFDNHSILRGRIPPAAAHFGPVVATCLQLDAVPRFIPLREPLLTG